MFKKVIIILSIILISGLSGIIADRYLFPHLAATKLFQRYNWLRKSTESVTVINKTEQVYVKEDTSVGKITSSVDASVVNVLSYHVAAQETGSNLVKAPKLPPAYKNGTGTIVTSDGIIMTYLAAIISENASYKVMTNDNNVYDAELLGVDFYSNLAFLKIHASNLPTVSFGNSDEAVAGGKVIAIGNNAERYQNKYIATILSNFNPTFNLSGKTLSSSEKMEGVFETNFPEEASYVGGPLIDYSGQVIGITGSVERDNKVLFFQIPSNKAKLVLDKAIKKELANNSQLGIYYLPLTKTYATVNNLKIDKGALIYSPSGQQGLAIMANSPAAKAGLKINDVIVAVSGENVTMEKTLSDILYRYKKGDEVELTIVRNESEEKVTVQL